MLCLKSTSTNIFFVNKILAVVKNIKVHCWSSLSLGGVLNLLCVLVYWYHQALQHIPTHWAEARYKAWSHIWVPSIWYTGRKSALPNTKPSFHIIKVVVHGNKQLTFIVKIIYNCSQLGWDTFLEKFWKCRQHRIPQNLSQLINCGKHDLKRKSFLQILPSWHMNSKLLLNVNLTSIGKQGLWVDTKFVSATIHSCFGINFYINK